LFTTLIENLRLCSSAKAGIVLRLGKDVHCCNQAVYDGFIYCGYFSEKRERGLEMQTSKLKILRKLWCVRTDRKGIEAVRTFSDKEGMS